MIVFQWRRGVGALSKKLGSVDFFQCSGGIKVYNLSLHDKKLITFYLYFHSNIS